MNEIPAAPSWHERGGWRWLFAAPNGRILGEVSAPSGSVYRAIREGKELGAYITLSHAKAAVEGETP